ncbi:uncharacterized protein LOC143026451 isoform X4 [Oratosquilla oratoria]|uniref:uncharacterized protein LOC143026451 isoform X4 n=1 Tax=Oratosquilla oratoria TaxID=337810 RepID=UPI003F7705D3
MREEKLPLRTILQNFINHVDTLEVKRREGDDGQYEAEFQELKILTESLKGLAEYSCLEGEKEVNRRKNRYKDILPYDYSRVTLSPFPGVPGSDYINANYIRGASGSRAYIACQGPLAHTVADLWRMVVECEVQVIIMASNEMEGGKHKCENYWVSSPGEERQYGNVTVSFVKARQVCPDFLVRTLKLKHTSDSGKIEERTICQFHYTLWPDHGVPDTVRPLLDMVRLVRDCQASETLPVLVHCSAGCGRTGTICAIDYVWGLLRAGRLTENLNVFALISDMRRQRVAMVQTKEQYILLHRAIREFFKERLKVIDAHPYENIATDGTPLILREKENDYEELYVKPENQGPLASSSPISTLDRPGPPLPQKSSRIPPLPHSQSAQFMGQGDKQPLVHSPLPSPSGHYHMPFTQQNKQIIPPPSKFDRESEATVNRNQENAVSASGWFTNASPKLLHTSPTFPMSCVSSHSSSALSTSISSRSPQPLYSVGGSPSTTPNITPTPLQGIQSGSRYSTLATPPISYNKSRTPSPVVTFRKSSAPESISCSSRDEEAVGKSSEIVRRPSIQKLKELFEKSPEVETPSNRLSRSASSVTARPGLSLHQDTEAAPKVKRKSSLGAEETIQTKKAFEIIEKSKQFSICPPASSSQGNDVPNKIEFHEAPKPSQLITTCVAVFPKPCQLTNTIVSAAKPPSSPIHTSPSIRRRGSTSINDSSDDVPTTALLARVDDKPALPIKKSKSFRYARPFDSNTNTIASTHSPELGRKKVSDINTYFSLERSKTDLSGLSRSESGNINFIGDIPSPRDGFKLSVYQMPNSSGSASSTKTSHEEKAATVEAKPNLPPKKGINEKFRSVRPPDSLYITTPQPYSPPMSAQSFNCQGQSSTTVSSTPGTPQSAPPVVSSLYENPPLWRRTVQSVFEPSSKGVGGSGHEKHEVSSQTSTNTFQSSPQVDQKRESASSASASNTPQQTPTCDLFQDSGPNKEYVNAKVVRSPTSDCSESPRYVYVPVPTKRGMKDKNLHDYVNCSVSSQEESSEIYMNPATLKKNVNPTFAKFPVYDEVIPTSSGMGSVSTVCSFSKSQSRETLAQTHSTATTPGSEDYEVMDFGEAMGNTEDGFETINMELVAKESRRMKNSEAKHAAKSGSEFCSKKDLDPIARQVYKDCQDYLLHGNNNSPIPSIMPKESKKMSESASGESFTADTSMDVDEVKSKVNVAPQGLRTRERRNSYRQAVNPVTQNEEAMKARAQNRDPKKVAHKYETIWFEQSKSGAKRENASPTSQQNLTQSAGANLDENLAALQKGIASIQVQAKTQLPEDHSLNINEKCNSKEALFREKLEELNSLVNSLERHRPAQSNVTSPTFKEEDVHSHSSSSNTSTLQSRSTCSSRSGENVETCTSSQLPPISRSNSSHSKLQQVPSGSTRHCDNAEYSLTCGPCSKAAENKGSAESRPDRQSPLTNGSSPYGTLASTAANPPRSKQPGSNSSSPSPYQNLPSQQQQQHQSSKSPTAYQNLPPAATLPGKTTVSPTPYHNIPPPKGFGSPSTSPNPLQAAQLAASSHPCTSPPASSAVPNVAASQPEVVDGQAAVQTQPFHSPYYYNMVAFQLANKQGAGMPRQTSGSSGGTGKSGSTSRPSGYSNLPPNAAAAAASRSSPTIKPKVLPKAHIVGDIAIVGDEAVRLRRAGGQHHFNQYKRGQQPCNYDSQVVELVRGYDARTSDVRPSQGAPVAPPRVKRNSSVSMMRGSTADPPAYHHLDWRNVE